MPKDKGKDERRMLRKFGITLGIIFGIIGVFLQWYENNYAVYFFGLSLFLISMGILAPGLLKPVEKGWMAFALILNWIMTKILLGIFFFSIFTIVGFLWRLFRGDPLGLRFVKGSKSYWIRRDEADLDKSRYENQF